MSCSRTQHSDYGDSRPSNHSITSLHVPFYQMSHWSSQNSPFDISYNCIYFSEEDHFVQANSVGSDEISLYAAYLIDLHCLPRYAFRSD